MKLSDAIELGSTMVELTPTLYLAKLGDKYIGCLIGQGAFVMGKRPGELTRNVYFDWPEMPWLQQIFDVPLYLGSIARIVRRAPAYVIIGYMASGIYQGVCTREQALAWIRANEPPDEPMQPQVSATAEKEETHVAQNVEQVEQAQMDSRASGQVHEHAQAEVGGVDHLTADPSPV
jgi:hypothetical protein